MKLLTIRNTASAAAVLLAAAVLMSASAEAKNSRIRFQCKAKGGVDISMHARYEIRTGKDRRKFSTEFEAGPTAGFQAGDKLSVIVDGANVGAMKLEELVGGDLVGDVNFDTKKQADAKKFPPDWPDNVGRDSTVDLKQGSDVVLGCTLG